MLLGGMLISSYLKKEKDSERTFDFPLFPAQEIWDAETCFEKEILERCLSLMWTKYGQ